jgi:hypothetical protein
MISGNFMRFNKALSSEKLEISQTGLTVTSTDKFQRVVCDKPMRSGIHYWEIICPIRLAGISFGVITTVKQRLSNKQTDDTIPLSFT